MRAVSWMMASLAAAYALGCGGDPEIMTQPFVGLTPPPKGQGFQISTGDLDVAPGTEQQDCYFYKVGDLAASGGLDPDAPVDLHRTQISYRRGSHHMNIFRVRSIVELDPANGDVQRSTNGDAPCSDSANWADWPLIANSQQGEDFDWTYPEGVVNRLDPDETIMLQAHYVNAATQDTPGDLGRVDVNFWVVPEAEVQHQLGTLFATKQSIRVCQHNPTPSFEGTCQFNSGDPVHVIGANGHFHSRGARFEMYSWDGMTPETPSAAARFYTSTEWNDPPMARSPELDAPVPAFGGVWYTCSYEWRPPPPDIGCKGLDELDKKYFGTADDQLDCCYTFGNTVQSAEHCNSFVYYYPKSDDVLCF